MNRALATMLIVLATCASLAEAQTGAQTQPAKMLFKRPTPPGGRRADIWVADLTPYGIENEQNLTQTPDINEGGARWSPDGDRIVFSIPGRITGGIYIMNANGTGAHKVADGAFPSWSPDGGKIAFIKEKPRGNGIGSMIALLDVATGEVQEYTWGFGSVWYDDRTLLFLRGDDDLMSLDVMTGDVIVLSLWWPKDATIPRRSPDGKWLLFYQGDLFYDRDGEVKTYLTPDPLQLGAERFLLRGAGRWTRDGHVLYKTVGRAGIATGDLRVMNIDGSADRLLAQYERGREYWGVDVWGNIPDPIPRAVHPRGKRPSVWAELKR